MPISVTHLYHLRCSLPVPRVVQYCFLEHLGTIIMFSETKNVAFEYKKGSNCLLTWMYTKPSNLKRSHF